MAANSQIRRLSNIGKEFVSQIRNANSPDPPQLLHPAAPTFVRTVPLFSSGGGRAAHSSAYDKNPEDEARPVSVPDDVIQPQSHNYWAPHPQTGVFGPATEQEPVSPTYHGSVGRRGEGESVMEHEAWFRRLEVEDSEKP